jgi:O-antigen/teichoic acid export membrane protein
VPRLRNNVIANYAGTGWVVLMSFLFVPVYIHFLGMSSYGLIGFFVSFQAVLALLDLGMGAAISRELARLSISEANATQMRDLLRTLEWLYWLAALAIALIVVAVAPLLASHWLQGGALDANTLYRAIVLMGLAFAARWPFTLYSGALIGTQQQVVFNLLKAGIETVRGGGAALVVWLVSPTLEAFLYWQIAAGLLGTFAGAWLAWSCLPGAIRGAQFQRTQLRQVWKFAAGMGAISITVVILTQADKLVLSRMLSLEDFGYYTLAWAVGGALGQLVSPMFSAFSPRLAQEVARHDLNALRNTYHQGAQWLAGIVLPVGATLAVFAREILQIWTRNEAIAERAHLVMAIVVAGSCLNALMNMPYALQLAHGWTRLALVTNVVAALLVVPLVVTGAQYYGMAGAASVWVVLNMAYLLVPLQIMHARLLTKEKRAWFVHGVLAPGVISVAIACLFRYFMPAGLGDFPALSYLALASLTTLAFTVMALPLPRRAAVAWISAASARMRDHKA